MRDDAVVIPETKESSKDCEEEKLASYSTLPSANNSLKKAKHARDSFRRLIDLLIIPFTHIWSKGRED